jgi:hypothetical protein
LRGEKDLKKTLILLFIFLLVMPLSSKANGELKKREDLFTFLKGGFEAQIALSEKLRTKEEINELLNPFFSERYQQEFWKANVVKETDKYITYGSDFAEFYIPFYQFSNRTKVVFMKNKIYVFEYFPERANGPVGYKSHYEGLLITKNNGEWKVDQYLFNNIPKNVIKKTKEPEKKTLYILSFFNIRPLYT